jgi:uncharacterized cupredoxin-like copper-binding protein
MKVRRPVLVLTALALAAVACGGPPASTAEVELTEFDVTLETPLLVAGQIELEVENYGMFPHTLVVSNEAGTVVAATRLIMPGESTPLTLHLDPGKYSFTCRIVRTLPDGTIADHYQAGMATTVQVVH